MDQSRPRHPPLKSPLVERPDLQSRRQQVLYGALTLAFWSLWFYLWLPLLALLAWALGIQQAFKYMVVLGGYRDVLALLGIYGLVILLLGGGLVAWATYNIIRFRGIERRTAALPVTATEIGMHFGQDPHAVSGWQNDQRLSVTHDQHGQIARVETLVTDAAGPG